LSDPLRDSAGKPARHAQGWNLLVAGIAALVVVQPTHSSAASLFIKPDGTFPKNVDPAELSEIRGFLAGGPVHWAVTKPPKLPSPLNITTTSGTLKDNALVTYLNWVRDLDPGRFDRRHPRLATLFEHQAGTQAAQFLSAPGSGRPVSLSLSKSPAVAVSAVLSSRKVSSATSAPHTAADSFATRQLAQEVLAAPVPEPSALGTILALFGIAAVWKVRTRAKSGWGPSTRTR
jgi:hypothetical protein